MELTASLLDGLRSASTFEAAAEILGRALRVEVPEALRVIVHLRGQEGYRGVHVVGEPTEDISPSATAWRWIEARREALIVDVARREVRFASGVAPLGDGGHNFRSVERWVARQAQGSIALPLRGLEGRVIGHVAIELPRVPLALSAERADHLMLGADLAALFLDRLPRREASISPDSWLPIIGARMQPIMHDLHFFARSELTVLFLGETGVGKSRMAAWLHHHSGLRGAFVRVNLSTVPENLRAGTLFGWKKGTFTGAIDERRGQIEEAQGGTLFIDEVDKLPLDAQAMLLDLLDDGTWRALGDVRSRQADVRIVVGTNADLRREVAAGRFLPDLLYRMNGAPINLPPLRDRRDEITGWANHFAREKARRRGQQVVLATEAEERLVRADWPGNLRMLETVVSRALALAVEQATAGIVIEARHIERALGYDLSGAEAVVEALDKAAELFVTESAREPGRLTLDHAAAFPGFVLDAAVRRLGEREAFRVLGKEERLKGSNHKQTLRAEGARSEALRAIFRQ